ncbi:MAG: hypothetical protein LZF62_240047 [Nitrospira sp.]|nr:MAG: hypothetical protein LZF62_240047 [Nitrospira sp.]
MSGLHHSSAQMTVAIVSTNHLVRIGLQAALIGQQQMRLIGEAASAREAMTLVVREQPHVLVVERETNVDVRALIRTVKTSVPATRIILLTSAEDNSHSGRSVSSGIDGIVLTIQPAVVLLATISHVCGLPATATVYQHSAQRRPGGAAETSGGDPPQCVSAQFSGASLTGREEEIILLIGQALSNKDIAERLCISSITVRHHLTSIFGKLDVHNRQQLLLRAYEYGFLKLGTQH